MMQSIKEHENKAVEICLEMKENAEDWGEAIETMGKSRAQFWYDASTFNGYALLLTLRHYPDELEFSFSEDERLSLDNLTYEFKLQLIQETHEDGSMTVRLVKTERDTDNES